MWQACLFCKKTLGSNEVVESFPVGRRLAFDAAKGRLWVVCRSCKRWNLTPLEERWEAVEACEKLFRDTRLRTSSENIGLARHSEGLELVRIGKPLRPEFAAWRYGDQLGERRRRQVVGLATGGPIGAAIYYALPPLATSLAVIPLGLGLAYWLMRRTAAKVRVGDASAGAVVTPDNVARFRESDLGTIRILPHDHEPKFRVEVCRGKRTASFEKEDARRVAGTILPFVNHWGATRKSVGAAVSQIESHQTPGRFLASVAHEEHTDAYGRVGYVKSMPRPTRLALEMALHEEQERRALEGELWLLEQAWKEADEIAAISDDLLLPAKADAFFDRHGKRG